MKTTSYFSLAETNLRADDSAPGLSADVNAIIYRCCCCSVAKLSPNLCDPMDSSTSGSSVFHYLLKFAQIHVHRVHDAIQPPHPPSPLSSIFPSIRQGLFLWVSSSHQVAKVLELQLQHHSPSNEYSGLISFRVDWFDLLAVQGTLKTVSQTRQLHSHGKGTRRSREPWWRGHYNSRWWPHKLWRQLFQSRFCSSFMASVSQLGLSLRSADAAPLESKWVWGCSFASGPLSPGADCIELRQKMEFPLPASLKELSKFTSLTEAIGAEFSLEQ